jgi:hypothetical protein
MIVYAVFINERLEGMYLEEWAARAHSSGLGVKRVIKYQMLNATDLL